MLTSQSLNKIMFFAIETTPMVKEFADLSPKLQECFKQRFKLEIEKSSNVKGDGMEGSEYINSVYQEKAALHPEFGRIAAISWGGLSDLEKYHFKSNQVSTVDEKEMLTLFADKLNKAERKGAAYPFSLCGFSAKGFNIPFLAKRMLINGMKIPDIIDMENLKPWEQTHIIDLATEWKMGSFESYVSLETLCAVFDVSYSSETPEVVRKTFYDKNYLITGDSCETKLVSLGNLYLRIKGIQNTLNIQK